MKKVIISVCVIVFFLFLLNSEEEQIRIRIIANSDSIEDQNYKKEVVKYLYENYEFNFSSIQDCDDYLNNNINMIKEDLTNNFIDIEVSYEIHNFNNKTYNNIVSNDNSYKTLLIKIGESNGENFWGILYSDDFIENEDTIKYNSYILELFKKGEK